MTRTITTAAELDALPFPNTVTFPGYGDWHKRRDGRWLCDDGDVLTSGALALVANGELTVTGDPSAPSEATAAVATPPVMRIEGTWLVEVVDEHTCGAGPGSGTGMHEPGCGLVPVLDLATLPGWDEHLTAAPAPASSVAAESALFEVERRLRKTRGYSAEDVRRMALLHIDAYRDGRARIVCEHQPAPSATREEVAAVGTRRAERRDLRGRHHRP